MMPWADSGRIELVSDSYFDASSLMRHTAVAGMIMSLLILLEVFVALVCTFTCQNNRKSQCPCAVAATGSIN